MSRHDKAAAKTAIRNMLREYGLQAQKNADGVELQVRTHFGTATYAFPPDCECALEAAERYVDDTDTDELAEGFFYSMWGIPADEIGTLDDKEARKAQKALLDARAAAEDIVSALIDARSALRQIA